jgi:hypothetical protein
MGGYDSRETSTMTTPRQFVEDAIRQHTDGSLTLRVDEDQWSVVAAYSLDGRLFTHAWPKYEFDGLSNDAAQLFALDGLRILLRKGNEQP